MAYDSDDDDDIDAMWDELGDDDLLTANISGNLAESLGLTATEVHKGDVDEGKITWVAPSFAGLDNSTDVTRKDGHWYKDDSSFQAPAKTSAAVLGPLAQFGAGSLFNANAGGVGSVKDLFGGAGLFDGELSIFQTPPGSLFASREPSQRE